MICYITKEKDMICLLNIASEFLARAALGQGLGIGSSKPRYRLQSKTVLTDVFIRNKPSPGNFLKPIWYTCGRYKHGDLSSLRGLPCLSSWNACNLFRGNRLTVTSPKRS